MTAEQIISEIQRRLEAHLHGALGYIGQDPYKSDFFQLFAQAYHNGDFEVSAHPRLTGDALRDILKVRWLTHDEQQNSAKRELMDALFAMWEEWRYAWDRFPRRD